MASQTPKINWIDLKRFGADLMISEKNQYRERLSVVVIHDLNQAIRLSKHNAESFRLALQNNGFTTIPSELIEHKDRLSLLYTNPNGSPGLNPRNFQNVFLDLTRQDVKQLDRSQIQKFTASQHSHSEWRNFFLSNRTIYQKNDTEYYQKDNAEYFIASGSNNNTLQEQFNENLESSSLLYLRNHQMDTLPIGMLSNLGYKGNALIKIYQSREAAYADGYDDIDLRAQNEISPFTVPILVQESGTIVAFEDLREVPEIFNHLPSNHPSWIDKAGIVADVNYTLNALNTACKNMLSLNISKEAANFEKILQNLSEDLRRINKVALFNPSYRESIAKAENEGKLYYLRQNKEDQQWYMLTRLPNSIFETELLTQINLFKLLNERKDYALSYAHGLSSSNIYSSVNNDYEAIPLHVIVEDFGKYYLNPETKLEPQHTIEENDIEVPESETLEDLIKQTGLQIGSQIQPPKEITEIEPNQDTVDRVASMIPGLEHQINMLGNNQQRLDISTAQPLNQESIDGSIDHAALSMIQQIGYLEREKTEIARRKYLENMASALKGTLGNIPKGATLDETLEQIAPQESVLESEKEIQENFSQYLDEHGVEPPSSDVIGALESTTMPLDTVIESGSDTLVFDSPHELYTELEVIVKDASQIPTEFIKSKSHDTYKQIQAAQSYRLYAKLYLLPVAHQEIKALQQLNNTLIHERNSLLEREMISNIGLTSELFPLTTSVSRPLEDITKELDLAQQQLSIAMDNQTAIQSRITRIEGVFSASLTEDRLVYTDDQTDDQEVINDRVTKAYQTLFSNESYQQKDTLNQFVALEMSTLLESQYPVNFEAKLSASRLPRFNRPFNRSLGASLKARMKARLNKKPPLLDMYVNATRKRVVENVSTLISQIDGRASDLPVLIDLAHLFKGFENLTGKYPFQFADQGTNLDRMMQKLSKDTSWENIENPLVTDDYGFAYSSQAVTDARNKIQAWVHVNNELNGGKDSALAKFSNSSADVQHENNVNRTTKLTTFFLLNYVDGKQPSLDVKASGWAMVKPNNDDQFKIKPYDINQPIDTSVYLPLKSRHYEIALLESFDQFRLNYTYSSLNIEKNQVESLENISKIIRTFKPENESHFKELSSELWGQELSYDDFKDDHFKLVVPDQQILLKEVAFDLQMGNSVIKGISGEELDRYSNTYVLAKILADAPLNKLNYDILPNEVNATAYASYIAPNEEFPVLREYFKPTAQDEAIPFKNPTQYINAMSEQTVRAWNGLITRIPQLASSSNNLYLLHPTMLNSIQTPIARLMPENIAAEMEFTYPREIGLDRVKNKWVNSEYVVNANYMSEKVLAAKNINLSPNEALLFTVNAGIKANARRVENMAVDINSPKYFPQIDNSLLPDAYKCPINLNVKMFDFIERNNEYLNELPTLPDVTEYNSNKVLADMLKNTDRNLLAKELPLIPNKPHLSLDYDMDEMFSRDHLKYIDNPDNLLVSQMNEPFVAVPLILYKGNSFNANDLSHLRAIPSYVKVPDSSNLKPFNGFSINSAHLMYTGENNCDAEKLFSDFDAASPREVCNVRIKADMGMLMKGGLDNPNHPSYDNFKIKQDMDEITIHESMSETMISDQNSLNSYYRENLNFQTELFAKLIESIKNQPEHPQNDQALNGVFSKPNVYIIDYNPNKFPLLVVDHKNAHHQHLSNDGLVFKVGQIDLDNISNLDTQINNLAASTGFINTLQSCRRAEKTIINTTEFTLSSLRLNDLDENTKQITTARYAQEIQTDLVWKIPHLFNNSNHSNLFNENYVLAIKPSTDLDLAKFKLIDVSQPTAKQSIDQGWKLLTPHEIGLKLSVKYRDIKSTEFLTKVLEPDDVLPKNLKALRATLLEQGTVQDGITKGYLGDVGVKTTGAKKDRYGYHFSFEDISQMKMVEGNSLITKNKIWKKPDFKQLAEITGDIKFAALSHAIYDLLPSKPKLLPNSEVNAIERVNSYAFYNDMVAGVRNATNESQNLNEFLSKLSILSRQLNINYAQYQKYNQLDSLYTTKKGWLGMSVSSLLLDVEKNLKDAYIHTRNPKDRFTHTHNLIEKAVRVSTQKILTPKHDFNYHLYKPGTLDFTNNPTTEHVLNKELALYANTGLVTKGIVDKLSIPEQERIKSGDLVVYEYEDILSSRPMIEIKSDKSLIPVESTTKTTEQYNFKGLVNNTKQIAITENVEHREGVISQTVNSNKWKMLNSARIGYDFRQGRNVDAFGLRDAFGMNAVEFGNTIPLYVRQEVTNLTYDSLKDLAHILNLSESQISLGTGVAFASRGTKGAKAHYEPENNIINISGQTSSGSLAHEWFHSLDNYLAKVEKNYLLSQKSKLSANDIQSSHFLSVMVDNGYKPRTPIAQMMVEIIEAIKYKQNNTESNISEKNLCEQLNEKKNLLKQEWHNTANTFKSSDLLKCYLSWYLDKLEVIAESYNSKIEKHFSKDAKHCKSDKDLSGFNYSCEQLCIFHEKSSPQFGITSITAFIKAEFSATPEKQCKEITKALMQDISDYSISDSMGRLHQDFNLIKITELMRGNLIKYAPDHLKLDNIIDTYVINHPILKKLNLDNPIPSVDNNSTSTEKNETEFYAFARKRDQESKSYYWASSNELFARAGEAYIVKKLQDKGFKNTFLASGGSNEQYPYLPMGPDLNAIEKKVDTLIEYIGEHILQSNNLHKANNLIEENILLESNLNKEKDNVQVSENTHNNLKM